MANANEFSQQIDYLNGGPALKEWGPYPTKEAACLAIENKVDTEGRNMRMGKVVAIGATVPYVLHWWKDGYRDEDLEMFAPSLEEFNAVKDRTEIFQENLIRQYAFPIVDAANRLLGGWRIDGSFEIAKWLLKNIPAAALKDFELSLSKLAPDVLNYFADKADLIPFQETESFRKEAFPSIPDGTDFVLPIVDAANRLLGGFHKDGSWYIAKYKSKTISGEALKDSSVLPENLSNGVKSLMWTELNPKTGYVSALIDAQNRILWAVKTDGTFFVPKLEFPIPDGSIPINKLTPELQSKINSGGSLLIIAWGDSLTAGAGGNGTTYLGVLMNKLGPAFTGINCGVGGENVPTIAARQGGVPAVITEQFVLPADTSVVTISSVADNKIRNTLYDGEILTLRQLGQNNTVNPCYVQGVECTLAWTGANSTDPSGTWTLKRNVAAQESKTILANSMLLFAGVRKYRRPFAEVIFIGQNGGYTTPDQLVDYYKRMIEFSGCSNYVVIGLHTGTKASRATLEKAMADAFGARYINWREYVSTYGLKDANITPTADDLVKMEAGSLPSSLWATPTDSIHLNAIGYTLLGELIYKRFLELGYVTI